MNGTATVAFTTDIVEYLGAAGPTVDGALQGERTLFVSKRGMIYIAKPGGVVTLSFPASDVTELQPCSQTGVNSKTKIEELQPIRGSAAIYVNMSNDKPILRCLFKNVKVLAEFSQYIRFFCELKEQAPVQIGYSLLRDPVPAAEEEEGNDEVEPGPEDQPEAKKLLNPIRILQPERVLPHEKVELLKDPLPIPDQLTIRDATTTNEAYLHDFYDTAETLRLQMEREDREKATEAVRSCREAAYRLKHLGLNPSVGPQDHLQGHQPPSAGSSRSPSVVGMTPQKGESARQNSVLKLAGYIPSNRNTAGVPSASASASASSSQIQINGTSGGWPNHATARGYTTAATADLSSRRRTGPYEDGGVPEGIWVEPPPPSPTRNRSALEMWLAIAKKA
jgi:hypothetical protein